MDESVEKQTLHQQAMDHYKIAEELWSDNRKAALEDMRFRAGDQWPEELKTARELNGRPLLVVDKLSQYVRQVVNDGRQNRPAVKVSPVDDTGDVEIGDKFAGIIRQIERKSNADIAYDTGLENCVVGGFGFLRVATDYVSRKSFNQDLKIMRVRNPFSVLLGPYQQADGSDCKFGFVIDEIKKKEFKARYPDAKAVDFETDTAKNWFDDDSVRIAEYFYATEELETMHLLTDGTVVSDEDYQAAITQGVKAPEIEESRELPNIQVKWACISGYEILEENEWLGKYIPIVPVIGNEYDIEGKVILSGLIRTAKDPQRLYNYSRSAYAERVALTPKAPFIAATGQVSEHPEWEDANTENYSVLQYDPVDVNGQMVPPPQRQSASDIPEGFARDMQLSEHDIQAAMGMYNSSLGAQGNEKSGKAILARQREGDTGTFHYIDNLNRAIRHIGVILVDLIPKIYDSRRIVRILGEDGKSEMAEHDPNQEQAVMRMGEKVVYNLGIGDYDVAITTGPSFTTRRIESAEAMTEMARANPQLWNTHGDLVAKAMDWPGHDEWAKRSRLVMPPELQQAIADDSNLSPDAKAIKAQADMAIKQLQDQIQGMEQGMQQAQQQVQGMELQMKDKQAKDQIESQRLEVEMFRAETERFSAEQNANQAPEDNSELERIKLEYENRWKELDAQVKLEIANIQSNTQRQNAQTQANTTLQSAQLQSDTTLQTAAINEVQNDPTT